MRLDTVRLHPPVGQDRRILPRSGSGEPELQGAEMNARGGQAPALRAYETNVRGGQAPALRVSEMNVRGGQAPALRASEISPSLSTR